MQGLFQRGVRYEKQSGSVLIISLLMTSLFLAIGMTIAKVNALEHKASTEIAYSNVAYQQAEIAMEFALNQIYKPIGIGEKTFIGYLSGANRRSFSCIGDGFIQSPPSPSSNDMYFKIAIYKRSDPKVKYDCNATFDTTDPEKNLKNNIGIVQTWGYYKGTIRSVQSKIIQDEQ